MFIPHFPSKILRAYDIRGLYPTEISEDFFRVVGQCFGTEVILSGGNSVCVGYDGRSSSESLEQALVEGLISTGLIVYRIGFGPSPLLYFAEKKLKTDGALMVTGSHNPKDYNGIKMILNQQPFFGEMIQDLGRKIRVGNFAKGEGRIVSQPLYEEYCAVLVDDFQTHYKDVRELRVAWDPGHGAAGPLLESMIQHLPGQHFVINSTVDGSFPAHDPDPTIAKNLSQLKQVVLENKCDVGIAFDGDADRIGILDNEGHFLCGDQFLILYAKEILQKNPGATILADVKASDVLFSQIKSAGGNPIMVSTGHSNIKHKMRETGALLAGEMSGHVFFSDRYYGYDDALYAAIRMLGIVAGRHEPLSQWRQDLPLLVNTPEIKIPCEDHLKADIIEKVRINLERQGCQFSTIDGVRVKDKNGWWLLRASNTQDYLVARVEADSTSHLDLLKEHLQSCLLQAGMIVKDI